MHARDGAGLTQKRVNEAEVTVRVLAVGEQQSEEEVEGNFEVTTGGNEELEEGSQTVKMPVSISSQTSTMAPNFTGSF